MKKHKFTWLDGLVLAVVLLLIAGTCYKFLSGNTDGDPQKTQQFQYQLKIASVQSHIPDYLRIGDGVYETETGSYLGVITDIVIAPATTTYNSPNGQVQVVEKENCYDITLTISAEGAESGEVYKMGDFILYVNKESTFHTKYTRWKAEIISID